MTPNFQDLKRDVLDTGLCTRCGGCAASCPVDAISFTAEGIMLTGECVDCGNCSAVCPGASLEISAHEKRLFGRSRTSDLGSGLGIYRDKTDLSAADGEIYRAGYFGGRITALLLNALEERLIDAALLTDWSGPGRLSVGKGVIARNREEVLGCAESKYVFSPVLLLLKDVEKDRSIGRVALVGLPCHIHAFRNMESRDETRHLTSKVKYVIGLNCGAPNLDEDGWRQVIEELTDVPKEDIANFRAGKISGSMLRMVVTRSDGEEISRDVNVNTYLAKIGSIGVWDRCLMCPDYAGDLSDLTFGMPYIRTGKGQELVDSALRSGALKRSSIKRRMAQKMIDRVMIARKKKNARKNIQNRKKRNEPHPHYR